MPNARHPARQLNSKTIRDAILTYVVPEVKNRYFIVSAKVVWRVGKDSSSLMKAWKLICEKREECDNAIRELSNIAFFFSAIASCESKEAAETSTFSSQETDPSIECEDAIDIAVQKGRFPAIAYWLALESPNGAPVSLAPLRRKLIDCEVEIDTRMLHEVKSLAKDYTKALSTVFKDHNSSYLQSIVDTSYEFCLEETLQAITTHGGGNEYTEEFRQSNEQERVLRFCIPKLQYWNRMEKVLHHLSHAGLKIQLTDVEDSCEATNEVHSPVNPRVITSDKTTQLVNDIERIMKRLQYAIYKGIVYRKCPQAHFTYLQRCSVGEFIGTLEGNELLKGRLVSNGQRIKDKLKQPECQLIHQLEINYDLIEVNDGWCLSLSAQKFVHNPIRPEDIGKISPRAFVPYDHNQEPDPKYFKEILENSLSDDKIQEFCNDFLGLLRFQKKKHKEKVN